ncbi:MAG: hemerythrin domain-containing protein, partial [Candidatus Eremiobacteraeota bacterium]|nr:hemerythrin domain-containing protein [Candidatus Eremiobacteraeota bacterium]
MDILSTLKREHREVAQLIDEVNECEAGDERLRALAQEIEQRLSVHMKLEEQLFYPELRDRAENSEELVEMYEAFTEHAAAKSLIEMVESGKKPDEQFKAELQVLGESIKHHVKEEESKVF